MHTHLCAGVVEGAKLLQGFGLRVEADDGLHDVGLVVPVQILKEARERLQQGRKRVAANARQRVVKGAKAGQQRQKHLR
jgi:hypothetical protein